MTKESTRSRRAQILEALRALQRGEHRDYRIVVETHRSGTYYSARLEKKPQE